MLVRILAALVAVVFVAEAIDPRLLRRNRTTPQPVQMAMPSHDELVSSHEDLTRRLEALERRLEESLAQIEHLQNTAGEVPRLTRKMNHAERNIADLEERIINGRCDCQNTNIGNGNGDDDDDREPPSDDWVTNMDKDAIHNLRRELNQDKMERNRANAGVNAQGVGPIRHELDNNAIDAFSLALAEIVSSRAVENGRMEGLFPPLEEEITDVVATQEEVALTTPTRSPVFQPQKPRPAGGFPFPSRRGRAVNSRYTREVTEDEATAELQAAFTDVLRSANKKVAFSSIRTEPLMGHGYPQSVEFQKNQANKGKAFDRRSGIFTCEIPGIYYFSYTMRSYDDRHIGVALMKNDDAVVAMTTDASQRKVMQTQSTMLSLVQGDQVWLVLGPSENFGIYGNDFNYNTFNGHILYPNFIS